MPIPYLPGHPVKRPAGFLLNPQFEGNDDSLVLRVEYPDNLGINRVINFRCTQQGSDQQEICIANTKWDLSNISRDTIVAHLRMASIISKTIPGSKEWSDALVNVGLLDSKYFQMAVGQVKLISWEVLDERMLRLEFQRGTTSDKVFHDVDMMEMTAETYTYAPSTQLLVIPGAIEVQFPNYHHDYPSVVLTTQQRQDIIDYVSELELWI